MIIPFVIPYFLGVPYFIPVVVPFFWLFMRVILIVFKMKYLSLLLLVRTTSAVTLKPDSFSAEKVLA